MKFKFDKKLLLTILISIGISSILTLIFLITSLLSWGLVLWLITMICLPFVKVIVEIYEEEKCLDMKDLWETLTDEEDDYDDDNYLR